MFAASKTAAVASAANYIEDVFSTYLYQGNGSTQTITNGIDLSGKGGLVWIKGRSGATGHRLVDTVRGATKSLESNSTAASTTESTGLTAFSSTGFSLGADADYNTNTATYVSWAFRKQSKFFDIVTYSGTGVTKTVSHNLGSVPGCIIVKRTDNTQNWRVYHRSVGNTGALVLNATSGTSTNSTFWNNTTPTATEFTVGTEAGVNASGATYEAYLFAHDAGGFGAAGTYNVISCGSFTTDGSGNASVTLGYEPQWLMVKSSSDSAIGWEIVDVSRGWVTGQSVSSQDDARLNANMSNAEWTLQEKGNPTATGFAYRTGSASQTCIYIAIRRGPMRTPTSGTSVYNAITRTGTGTNVTVTGAGFPVDLLHSKAQNVAFANSFYDRLRGATKELVTNSTAAETTDTTSVTGFDVQDGERLGADTAGNATVNYAGGYNYVEHFFRRAPGFFDVVCDKGTSTTKSVNHNLGVVPEFMIRKSRTNSYGWPVYHAALTYTSELYLQTTAAAVSGSWDQAPTSSVFYVQSPAYINSSSDNYVTYLFASCPGVSKVGSYTGTGTTQTINCGFTAGSRFVMIKRTDSTGDWYVWDSARGIVAGNDPYLLLNSTAAEVTNTDYVDTANSGFEISSTAPAGINANGGTYIFLAIA